MAACPYSARMFHWQEPLVSETDKGKEYNIELNVPQKKGTISKCLFSADRLREDILPYCVSACPNGVPAHAGITIVVSEIHSEVV